ncbi:HAD-IIA family hydrolase [Paludifilum halophilum]|uniref:Acid sugar phosphatase n=1 Tax=Paludifilum halophilum TaxID=1642702 RepID=A0A235B6F2_9BACL|nr:HAD-IIA family hydrolase [Paludifilum halophilum]OYD07812.1 HAD family hydrolase [Paludifilum halophilum]
MRGYIFDLDGTVYLGERPIPGAAETIDTLRSRGDRVVFLSNKPIATRHSYVEKLNRMGIAAELKEVINSSLVAARYLRRVCVPGDDRVLVIGEVPIREELADHGVAITECPEEAQYVLLSWDRHFTYEKLDRAFRACLRGAIVIASNPDRTCPTEQGPLPDTGGLIGALEGVTGKPIDWVAGKPSPMMAAAAVEQLGLDYPSCLMVGDRLETDIRMGNETGMQSALVLTGITSRMEAEASEGSLRPQYILNDITELLDLS